MSEKEKEKSNAIDNTYQDNEMKFVSMLREHYANYHNHKETMSHAGLLVQLGLFTFIISLRKWPPTWCPDVHVPSEWSAFIVYTFLWLLITLYIGWQLSNRREASEYIERHFDYFFNRLSVEERERTKNMFSRKGTPLCAEITMIIGCILILIIVFARTYIVAS